MAGRGAWRLRLCSDDVPHSGTFNPSRTCSRSSSTTTALQSADASLLPGRRWRRRRRRTCVRRRARWRAPPWGTQRRTRHRRMTTVSSTSSFRRRRRRRLLGIKMTWPRHHIRRRLRRAARCVGAIAAAPAEHACTQRHRSVLLHARARARHPSLGAAVRAPTGPAWSPSSSPPQRERVKARGERSAPVVGKWRECCEQICRPRAPHASVGRSAGMSWQD